MGATLPSLSAGAGAAAGAAAGSVSQSSSCSFRKIQGGVRGRGAGYVLLFGDGAADATSQCHPPGQGCRGEVAQERLRQRPMAYRCEDIFDNGRCGVHVEAGEVHQTDDNLRGEIGAVETRGGGEKRRMCIKVYPAYIA